MNSKRPLWSLTIRRTSTWPAITISNASQASKTELIPTGYRSTTGYLRIGGTCTPAGNLKRENRFTEARRPIFLRDRKTIAITITKILGKIRRDSNSRRFDLSIDIYFLSRINRKNVHLSLPFRLTVVRFRRIRKKKRLNEDTIKRRCEDTQGPENER